MECLCGVQDVKSIREEDKHAYKQKGEIQSVEFNYLVLFYLNYLSEGELYEENSC